MEPALEDVDRNVERWRDKIEVRLDNRQVFFLFFGSAVVACMLFVLGVMVGKRIESRGQADVARAAGSAGGARSRAHAAVPGSRRARAAADVSEHADRAERQARRRPTKLASVAPAPKPVPWPRPRRPSRSRPSLRAAAAQADRAAGRSRPRRPPRPPAAKPTPPLCRPSRPPPTSPRRSGGCDPTPAGARRADRHGRAADAAKGKGKFTLHLSTFASAEEANAFAQHYPGAFVVAGDVPGRGLAYRVRYGNFPTYKDATSAKDNFEKQHNVIALVAAR